MQYALRLAAGFGPQVSMALLRYTPLADGRRRAPSEKLGYAYRIVDQAAWQRWLDDPCPVTRQHPRGGQAQAAHRQHRCPGHPVVSVTKVPVPYADMARVQRSSGRRLRSLRRLRWLLLPRWLLRPGGSAGPGRPGCGACPVVPAAPAVDPVLGRSRRSSRR